MPLTASIALSIASFSVEETKTVPSSSISMTTSSSSWIFLMTFPLGPITAPILSVGITTDSIFGANSDIVSRGVSIAFAISPRICKRPAFACSSAFRIISIVIPAIFKSI